MLLTANKTTIIKAGVTASFASLNIDASKVSVIREAPTVAFAPFKSFVPGRAINSILGFVTGRDYIIQPLAEFEVTEQAGGSPLTWDDLLTWHD